jgi:hypothetical protein
MRAEFRIVNEQAAAANTATNRGIFLPGRSQLHTYVHYHSTTEFGHATELVEADLLPEA